MFLFLSGIVLFTYYRHERVLIALFFMRKQNLAKAEKMLNGIKNPEASLVKGNLAYYYLLQGMIQSQNGIGKNTKRW